MAESDEQRAWFLSFTLQEARAAHERHHQGQAALFESVIAFSQTAVNAAMAINGGAAVAILAFIGALLGREHVAKLDYLPLVRVLEHFGAGVLFSAIAAAAGYFAQYLYHWQMIDSVFIYEHPYIRPQEGKSKTANRWKIGFAVGFHLVGVALVMLAFLAFFLGSLIFAEFARVALPTLAKAA